MADELGVIKQTLRNYRSQLLDRSNVVAAGVGYKIAGGQKTSTLSIICSVTKKMAASQLSSRDLVPGSLDDNNNLVGLLFAGSDTSTIMNRIQNVFSELGVSL